MPLTEPLRLPMGWSNSYLVPAGEGVVLVDAGLYGTAGRVYRALAAHALPPDAIRLIVVTHVHLDHVGALAAIQARCGAPVMVHLIEADLLRQGQVVVPHGTNRYGKIATTVLAGLNRLARLRFRPCQPAHVVTGGESLATFGLAATLLHTPGHTAGSITVLCDNGDAFVGDLAVNHSPFGLGPIYPPFGDDGAAILASWDRLRAAGAKRLYPGHGTPFPAARLNRNH